MQSLTQPHLIQQLLRLLQALVVGGAREHGGQGDVLQRGQHLYQVEALEDVPDLPAPEPGELVGVQLADVHAVDEDVAFRGLVETTYEIEERGLAAAAGSDDGHVLAALYLQFDAVESLHGLGAHLVVSLQVT